MPRPIFFLRVKTEFGNLGDALINWELIRLLASHGDMIINLGKAPPRFKAWIENSIPSGANQTRAVGFWLQLVWALIRLPFVQTKCWVVLNPGGYVGEVGRTAMIGKLFGAVRLQALRRFGCKTILVGVSNERLEPRLLGSLWAQAKALDFDAPRDSRTPTFCDENRTAYSQILPDLAFALPTHLCRSQPSRKALASFRRQTGLDPVGLLGDLHPRWL